MARRQWAQSFPVDRWRSFSPVQPCNLPPEPACYVLLLDGVAVYVGQTVNLRTRFYKHAIRPVGEEEYSSGWGVLRGYLTMKVRFGARYGDWAMREARLINKLSPRFNKRAS